MTLCEGNDITIIGTGNILTEALKSRCMLERNHISTRIINMHTIKPIDKEIILKALAQTKAIVTLEDHNIVGGLGSAVAEIIAESGKAIPFARIGLQERFAAGYGNYSDMKKKNGIDAGEICRVCLKLIENCHVFQN